MFKILITDDLSPQALTLLDEAKNVTYDVIKGLSEAELTEKIADYDGLIIRSSVKVTKPVLENAKKLKAVGRAGVGVDNVDLDQASMQGVIVMNTPGANSMATAEHTMSMLLALCRHIPQAHASLKAGEWSRKQFVGTQLYHKTIGLIGLGRIGSRVALRCQAFGMNVLAYDPYIGEDVAHDMDVTLVDLDTIFAQSDFISLHTAHTAETDKMINADSIAKMKDGACLINCARGALINDDDLAAALKSGKLKGAALDVFVKEPLPQDHPFRNLDNLIFTPHLAASTVEAQDDVGTQIVSQVLGALRGDDIRNAVNLHLSDPKVFQTMRPFLDLAEKVGSLQTQLADGRINRVEVEFKGELSDQVKLLTVALLKGLLSPILEENVNYINTPHLAERRGITVSQVSGTNKLEYPNLISCKAMWEGGSRQIVATVFHTNEPRIVFVDNYRMDVKPSGRILVIESVDTPGFIGKIGSILGDAEINIAAMRFGRTKAYGETLTFVKVDSDVPDEVVARILAFEPVNRVRQITL